MKSNLLRVVVTGAAGQIAYNFLFRLASGEVFGPDQPLALHLLELPEAQGALEGVKMELEDCAFSLLREIKTGFNPFQLFDKVDYAILIGAKPRGPNMERGDLLMENAKIFIEQGKALNEAANPNVKILVVGNPCNTNCWIAMQNAPRIRRENFHAMMRLDQNRAVFQLAKKAAVNVEDISHVVVWGNHSSTQVPDFTQAKIKGKNLVEVIHDQKWLEGEFFSIVQKRGAAIIAERGKSSAASAANAAIDSLKSMLISTPSGHWFSAAVCSDNNPYGIKPNLIFSFPCRSKGDGTFEIVPELRWNEFIKNKISLTEKELIEERDTIAGGLK